MAGEDTPVSQNLRPAQIAEYLNKAAQNYICPICGKRDFTCAYDMEENGEVAPFQMISKMVPQVLSFAVTPVVCTSCGYTALFSNKIMSEKIHGNNR